LDRQQGGENDSQQNHQDSDVRNSHEWAEALVMVAIVVESNLTTMHPQTDQAAAGVVSLFNMGKWLKSCSP
jgi:hypothetical protein